MRSEAFRAGWSIYIDVVQAFIACGRGYIAPTRITFPFPFLESDSALTFF